jgi:hypothetical protein
MFSDAQSVWEWRDGIEAFRGRHGGSMSVVGFDVMATDGRIGTIDNSSGRFGASCLVVDAEPWIDGRKILVPAGTVTDIDRDDETVRLDRSRAEVEESPGYDPETFTRPQYRDRVAHYFARTYQDA